METNLSKLSKVRVNDKNPRTITEDKLRRLVESILVFPKMLTIRPIVIDDKGVALGGNMRTRALKEIKKLGRDGLQARL
jgi:arsenate reductase-like glutaredoxin family protein